MSDQEYTMDELQEKILSGDIDDLTDEQLESASDHFENAATHWQDVVE